MGPLDYILWFLSALAEAGALVCAFRGRAVKRYLSLSLYLVACLLVTAIRYTVFIRFGYRSVEYAYAYFFTDCLAVVCMFFALMGLYSHVFVEMGVSRYLKAAAIMLLAGTALVSAQIVSNASNSDAFVGPFVIELSRNLYFVGLVLTYMLWIAMMKLRETRTRLIQFIAGIGVYVSAMAANYALHKVAPGHSLIWSYMPPLMDILLPVALGYTFVRIPEEARLATARVAAHAK